MHKCTRRGLLSFLFQLLPELPSIIYSFIRSTPTLHTGRDQLPFLPRVVFPTASQRLAAVLLGKLLHARLQLGPEVADKTLDGPGKRLAES